MMEKRNVRKNEWILISVILVIAAMAFVIFQMFHREESAWVKVSVNGENYAQFLLSQDQELLIEGKDGGRNRLVIKDGKAWITEADCPDKICESMGQISGSGQTITCLPNRIVVEISGSGGQDEGDSVDALLR